MPRTSSRNPPPGRTGQNRSAVSTQEAAKPVTKREAATAADA
ncbi:hypothetical protein [Herbiconiux daphne]|uniref:Uncharacterized protein n=1 Tax=Herbiconiux daphne TaxID=2970914 RepID=A0ABT2H5S3_9MICO|nr:hypothetical protein [Herbiconiux daphne]MCS5735259.1 hypothetical protein [Herbiconiux daphne]